MMDHIYFAPMEGITGYVFRNAHHKYFGGVDKYFTPFLSPNQAGRLSTREKRDIAPEHNEGMNIVPQVLTNRAQHFIWVANVLKDLGYEEVNLNLGCPSGTVAAKKKGAGFLGDLDTLDDFLEEIFEKVSMKISIKTRLGVEDPEEFHNLLEIYESYPLEELIIHPRVRSDFYKGQPRMEYYMLAELESHKKICYNGNIFRKNQYEEIKEKLKRTDAVMIGRGVLANPALPQMIKGGADLDKETFLHFHQEILDGYLEWNNGDRNALFKMKELWYYFAALYPEEKKSLKKIKKAQKVKDYMEAVKTLVSNVPLQTEPGFIFH